MERNELARRLEARRRHHHRRAHCGRRRGARPVRDLDRRRARSASSPPRRRGLGGGTSSCGPRATSTPRSLGAIIASDGSFDVAPVVLSLGASPNDALPARRRQRAHRARRLPDRPQRQSPTSTASASSARPRARPRWCASTRPTSRSRRGPIARPRPPWPRASTAGSWRGRTRATPAPASTSTPRASTRPASVQDPTGTRLSDDAGNDRDIAVTHTGGEWLVAWSQDDAGQFLRQVGEQRQPGRRPRRRVDRVGHAGPGRVRRRSRDADPRLVGARDRHPRAEAAAGHRRRDRRGGTDAGRAVPDLDADAEPDAARARLRRQPLVHGVGRRPLRPDRGPPALRRHRQRALRAAGAGVVRRRAAGARPAAADGVLRRHELQPVLDRGARRPSPGPGRPLHHRRRADRHLRRHLRRVEPPRADGHAHHVRPRRRRLDGRAHRRATATSGASSSWAAPRWPPRWRSPTTPGVQEQRPQPAAARRRSGLRPTAPGLREAHGRRTPARSPRRVRDEPVRRLRRVHRAQHGGPRLRGAAHRVERRLVADHLPGARRQRRARPVRAVGDVARGRRLLLRVRHAAAGPGQLRAGEPDRDVGRLQLPRRCGAGSTAARSTCSSGAPTRRTTARSTTSSRPRCRPPTRTTRRSTCRARASRASPTAWASPTCAARTTPSGRACACSAPTPATRSSARS